MNHNTLNDKAMERFIALRHKLKLDVQQPILKKAVTLTQEHIDKMMDSEQSAKIDHARATFDGGMQEAIEVERNISYIFDFIDNLKLPPQLSLAIGLIISGHKTNKLLDIESARLALRKYLYEGGFLNAEKEREETDNQGT